MDRHGNLSGKPAPVLILVFENALGYVSDDKNWRKASGKGRWEQAMDSVVLNELLVRRILWLFHKRDMNIEVVTFISEGFADEIATRLDAENIPVRRVFYTTPTILARQTSFMPDLLAVYDPEPERWACYGSKGRYIRDANELGEL